MTKPGTPTISRASLARMGHHHLFEGYRAETTPSMVDPKERDVGQRSGLRASDAVNEGADGCAVRDDQNVTGAVGRLRDCAQGIDNACNDLLMWLRVGRGGAAISEVARPRLRVVLRTLFARQPFETT